MKFFGIFYLLIAAFIILKLIGVITWSWLWVLFPLWLLLSLLIPIIVYSIVFIIIILISKILS